ncbi:MAG TPA: class I SAM-dependent methyltransferase [Thermoanaerobaculia bacterium]|nr:class I SAM-dependent methyltransferase [Thermoanaerobaculia bacterium]
MNSKGEPAYGAFAYAYDKALGERFFRSARRMLNDILERYPSPEHTHLDVACGTGLALEYFISKGWRSVGIDVSLPMIAVARRRVRNLVAADVRALPLRGTFGRITCLYDSLNHLKSRADLVAAFRAVRRVMGRESLFLFDMNHPDIYPEIWGMKEPFVASGPDYHLEIATAFRSRDGIGRAFVTGWAMTQPGRRVEIRETHEQRAYSEREIVESLGDAGLSPIEILDFDPYNEADELEGGGVKFFFVCRAI